MRNANTAFMVTPARITIVRFHTGWRSNARSGSIGMADFPPSTPPATPSSSSPAIFTRSEEHTSELQSPCNLVCRLLLEKKKNNHIQREYGHTNEPHALHHYPEVCKPDHALHQLPRKAQPTLPALQSLPRPHQRQHTETT